MSAAGLESFEKINYLLRPSKQVERKLFVEALHRLASLGYCVPDYTYLGLGSVYYADFLLFHKYLYLDDMICAESAPIPKRMMFNRPFDFIRLEMKEVAELIPDLKRDRKHFVWLDYDDPLDASMLQDTAGLLHVLAPGSILVVTVDAEPRLPKNADTNKMTGDQLIDLAVAQISEQLGRYYSGKIGRSVFTPSSLPPFYANVLMSHIREQISKRANMGFLQLFNFQYADGAHMLSLGGLIDDKEQLSKVRASDLFDLDFVHDDTEPILISVPPLTMREKHHLDQIVRTPGSSGDLPFELDEQMLTNFCKYYRHYPTYQETLL